MVHVKLSDVEAALRRKGFQSEKPKGDHTYYRLYTEAGKTQVTTKVSHGAKSEDLRDELVSRMSKQLFLSKAEFVDLVTCPLSKERLVELLTERGHL